MELYAGIVFEKRYLKYLQPETEAVTGYDSKNTAVTPNQMSAIIHFLKKSCDQCHADAIVEVGSYRGVTTTLMASVTKKTVYAVDPFIGYGGAEQDFRYFQDNTSACKNIVHLRMTSGEAARGWGRRREVAFAFIDAVHDFVNTNHDIEVWSEKLAHGGMLALHDTDNKNFSGTRLAVANASKRLELLCHIPDLVIFGKA